MAVVNIRTRIKELQKKRQVLEDDLKRVDSELEAYNTLIKIHGHELMITASEEDSLDWKGDRTWDKYLTDILYGAYNTDGMTTSDIMSYIERNNALTQDEMDTLSATVRQSIHRLKKKGVVNANDNPHGRGDLYELRVDYIEEKYKK